MPSRRVHELRVQRSKAEREDESDLLLFNLIKLFILQIETETVHIMDVAGRCCVSLAFYAPSFEIILC